MAITRNIGFGWGTRPVGSFAGKTTVVYTLTDVYNLVQDTYDLVDDLTTDVADLTADVAALTTTVDAQTDTINDEIIPKLEALQMCCYENTKNGVILIKDNNSIKRDLKLLIASTERMKKGRL